MTQARTAMVVGLLVMTAVLAVPSSRAEAQRGGTESCLGGTLDQVQDGSNLVVKVECAVGAGTYKFGNVHILAGGVLRFADATIDFWAANILVENGGTLLAGVDKDGKITPIGTSNPKNILTFHIYGKTQASGGSGIKCLSTPAETCGAPPAIFFSNMMSDHHTPVPPAQAKKIKDLTLTPEERASYKGTQYDYFYAYHPLFHDEGDSQAYFGYKVLGVGYGGTLQLFGKKGAVYSGVDSDLACSPTSASSTGRSWVRLAATANAKAPTITVEANTNCGLDWADGDEIVITTTDYLPGHSEQRKITGAPVDNKDGTYTITLDRALDYIHNGKRFPLDEATHPGISRVGLDADLTAHGAETRAAVALLSRSIRIVSAGPNLGDPLPKETDEACTSRADPSTNTCYFGAHTVFRQGYAAVQIQGVEFFQMGQGGRLGHYPVHFHHARKTQNPLKDDTDQDLPRLPATFVLDSSIWDSMTRWIVLHGTQDVTLARNVGWKSIGHGFYLEDATEINNQLLANIGIFARAAVDNGQNPRKVPGILSATNDDSVPNFEHFPYKSDYDHPTVFWIMNGWNDFQHNMAAGAGSCGACYWLVSGANSTISRDHRWESYASMQTGVSRAGTTPLKTFIGNFCSSAMISFQTVTKTDACLGVGPTSPSDPKSLAHIPNPLARSSSDLGYFPTVHPTGGRIATRCDGESTDCSAVPLCGAGPAVKPCMVTHLDRYTSSFHWATKNFSAIWLRPQWYLVSDSVLTDVQQAGLTSVTGGGYTESDVITGHWALTTRSVFIGNTQDCPTCEIKANGYASNGGPFNLASGLRCAQDRNKVRPGNFCLAAEEGVSFPVDTFGSQYQRLFDVYDGPAVQDSNAYLNIRVRHLDDCAPQLFGITCEINSKDPECDLNCRFLDPPDNTKKQCDKPNSGRCAPCKMKDGACAVPFEADTSVSTDSSWIAGPAQGLPKGYKNPLEPKENEAFCFLPNAAIGWKQPNGFYYPPAFRSQNLFFHDVDIRHFVVTPLFVEGTLATDIPLTKKHYCKWDATLFNGFNSIDRQTVLNDSDGSLTGYRDTTVINYDDFFLAPVDAVQCQSEASSRTSPYQYVTSVIYPGDNARGGDWSLDCATDACFGVPLYRLDLMPRGDAGQPTRSIRMAGQQTYQRSTLTVNHGTYYIDTAVPGDKQDKPNKNVFREGGTYYLFLIFAREDTEQTYRFYVGKKTGFKPSDIKMATANIATNPPVFGEGKDLPAGRATWYDEANGIVQVVLKASDLTGTNGETFAQLIEAAKVRNCQPASFCTWNATTKTCNDLTEDGKDSGVDTICRWAVTDMHCPEGGCPGVVFTLPAGFAPVADNPIPAATCVKDAPPWNVRFSDPEKTDKYTPEQIAGTCYQSPTLLNDFCR